MKDTESLLENRIIKEHIFNNHTIKLEQVADVEKLVDEIADDEFNKDERLPYWAEVWPSAQALSGYILNNQIDFNNKKVLELGCGIGLVGIAATHANANVIFSDYEKEAVQFTKHNYFLNFQEQANTVILDWREPNLDKKFETIIAADILYENRFLKPVYNTIQKLLAENGKLYIAEPDRTIAKPFFDLMKDGFELVEKKTISNIKSVTLYKFKKC